MELIGRKRVKTIAFVSLLGYGALLHEQTGDFDITARPVKPVLDADIANVGSTAIVKDRSGYYQTPPDAPIEVRVRFTAGAALPPNS